MSDTTELTEQERDADLSAEQLQQLVGLVEYDASADPFPVSGWDSLVWIVGNAVQNTGLGLVLLSCRNAATPTFTANVNSLPTACAGGTAPERVREQREELVARAKAARAAPPVAAT